MEEIPLTKKFITGEAYYRLSALLTKGLGFFSTLLVLHALTLYQYGVLQLLLSIFGVGMVVFYLAGNVISTDVQRFIAEGKEAHAKKLFIEYNTIRMLLGVLLMLGMIVGTPLLSHWYKPDFIEMLQIIGLYFIVEAASATLLTLVKVRLNFRAAALEPSWGKVGQVVALLIFAFTSGISTEQALIAGLIGNMVSVASMVPGATSAWRQWHATPRHPDPILWGVLRAYGKWDSVRQILSNFVSNIQPWLIKVFISTEAVAVYSVALTMVDITKTFLSFDTLPSIVPRQIGDMAVARRTFVLSIKYIFWMATFFTIAALIAGPIGIAVFFPKYMASLPYFAVLVWSVPLGVFITQTDLFLIALREQKFLFAASLSRNLLTPLFLALSLPVIGLWGAVFAKLAVLGSLTTAELGYLFSRYPMLRFSYRELLRYTLEDRLLAKTFVSHFRELATIKIRSLLRSGSSQ